ncbi:hypothetical protein Agabi119p4_5581 [Agaricus bisporus var. burnettii]|uniref:Uncharacterized protein n=1 Tax=Agaricus bisporus var. burnettii TaxID=192524 RepID=A0A8H7KGP1_AGABI|nr:hypothetical protein Agabi119p4_5581 [Agaricus bisporus var. burnettii]
MTLTPLATNYPHKMQLYLSLTRMHHIRSASKFRRLKAFAESAKVSGFAKKGRPGVLVYDGEKDEIRTFLSNARSLRYLDFHHVDTVPLPEDTKTRIANGRIGLQDAEDMGELVKILDSVGMKHWFRQNMGMAKGP